MRTLILLPALAALAACSSMTPANDPVYLRITDIEARLIRLERVLENESLITLAGDIASLRNELQVLLGEVETLRYELDNQGDRQRDLYVDLDQRLAQIEAEQERLRSMPVAQAGGSPAAAVNDQQAYDAAFAELQQQDFAAAQVAFENFLRNYPASPLRSNAQYWLAETHYGQLSFETAVTEFERVLSDYPDSAKLPDALLKIGFSHYELGDSDAARQSLLQVVRQHPDTSAAGFAEDRLAQIASESD